MEKKSNRFGLMLVIAIVAFMGLRYFKNRDVKKSGSSTTGSSDTDSADLVAPAKARPTALVASGDLDHAEQKLKSYAQSAARGSNAFDAIKVETLRSQAKGAMATGYTAMVSMRAEWDRFSTDLKASGFGVSDANIPFKMGFIAPFQPATPIEASNSESPSQFMTLDYLIGTKSSDASEPYRYSEDAEKINFADYAKYCQHGCTATETSFEILLVLPIPGSAAVDVWLINEKKQVTQVVDGLQAP